MASLPKPRPERSQQDHQGKEEEPPLRVATQELRYWYAYSICTLFITFLSYFIGQDIRPKTDLTRFVKWPEYVRLQRQKVNLHRRLKVLPAIA